MIVLTGIGFTSGTLDQKSEFSLVKPDAVSRGTAVNPDPCLFELVVVHLFLALRTLPAHPRGSEGVSYSGMTVGLNGVAVLHLVRDLFQDLLKLRGG